MALQICGVRSGGGAHGASAAPLPLDVKAALSREDVWSLLAQASTEDEQASSILDLAQRGEAEVAASLDLVVSLLHSEPPPKVKAAVCQAVRAAGAFASATYVSEVAALLSDQSPEVKYQACLALAGAGASAAGALPALRRLLADSAELVRYGACAALGGLGASPCAEDLAALLSDKSPEVQGAACWALGKLGPAGRPSAGAVAERLSEPRCRLQALRALALLGPRAAGPYCEDVCACLADDDGDIRAAAAFAVGRLASAVAESSEASVKVSGLLLSDDGRLRITGAAALGAMGRHGADQVDALRDLLTDEYAEPAATALSVGGCRPRLPAAWRKASCAAAAALGRVALFSGDASSAAEDLCRLLDSPDWEHRAAACEALANLGVAARAAAAPIAELFGDSRAAVRAKAAFAYGRLGEVAAVERLAKLLEDKAPSVREQAALALVRLGDEGGEFIEKVAERLTDSAPTVRAAAADALGASAAMEGGRGRYYAGVVAQRLAAGEDEALVVRIAAARALGSMGERGAVYSDLVAELVEDPRSELRAAAERSLRAMGAEGYRGAVLPIEGFGGGEGEGGGEGDGIVFGDGE